MVPFATSSDGGGSTRTPAGFCGLVGLKTSYGRIPDLTADHYGQTAVAGALAKTVADSARLLDVMAGPHRRDRCSLPAPTVRYEDAIESLDVGGMRIAWSSDLGFAVVDPEVAEIARAAFDALVSAASLTVDAHPIAFADPIPVWAKVGGADTWVHIPDGCWPDRADELDPLVRPGFDAAARVTLPKFGAVLRQRLAIEDAMAEVFDSVDVLATPMTAIPAFAAEGPMPREIMGQRVHAGMSVPFAMLANLWGSPAISVPAGDHRVGVCRSGCTSWPTATAKTCACAWPASWSRRGRGRSERRRADGRRGRGCGRRARLAATTESDTEEHCPADEHLQRDEPQRDVAGGRALDQEHVGRAVGSVEDPHGLAGVLGPGVHPFGLRHLYDVATRGCEPHLVPRRRDDDCGGGLDPSGSAPAFADLQIHDHGRDHESGEGDCDSPRDPLLRAAAQGLGRERRLLLRAGPGAHHGRHRAGGAGRAALDGGGDSHLVVAVPEPFVAEHVVGRGHRLEPLGLGFRRAPAVGMQLLSRGPGNGTRPPPPPGRGEHTPSGGK